MNEFDETLVRVYSSFGVSVDRIASSASLRTKFRSLLPAQFSSMDDDQLTGRLLNLRKSRKLSKTQRQEV